MGDGVALPLLSRDAGERRMLGPHALDDRVVFRQRGREPADRRHLHERQRAAGMVEVLVTHDQVLAGRAHRIIRLADGRVVEDTMDGR